MMFLTLPEICIPEGSWKSLYNIKKYHKILVLFLFQNSLQILIQANGILHRSMENADHANVVAREFPEKMSCFS